MPPDRRFLLIDVDVALKVRGEVGPIGWSVLEAIASQAPPDQAVVEVVSSARSLSQLVGLSKDTMARSLRFLIELGIVARSEHRDELSGRFLSTTYRLDLSRVGISVVVPQQAESVSSTSSGTRSRTGSPAAQLSLLS